MGQLVTSWRWLVGLASSVAFVLGAGTAWVWLAQRETTPFIGDRSKTPVPQKDIPPPPAQAEPISPSAPMPSLAVAEPSPLSSPRPTTTVAVPDNQVQAATRERASLPKRQPAFTPPHAVQAPQGRGSAAAPQAPAGKKAPLGKPTNESLAASGVRSWQRSGQWVVLVSRAEGHQVQRLEQTRQQLAPLVPNGLQLVVLSKREARLLVLGPFPSEEAAGEALWALPTPFLLKQPQVMPARALF